MKYSLIRTTLLGLSLSFASAYASAAHHASNEKAASTALQKALATQPDEAKARYQYRNPGKTLEFFGIEPGMKVVEVLPGGGWYSKILLPVLGADGELIGVDYPQTMWVNFSFMTPERIEEKKTWVSTWTEQANAWRGENSAKISAFQLNDMPDDKKGSADAVVFIRALHNLARFESKDGYLTSALKQSYDVLKPGGIVGVVQHRAREDRPDEWADGSNGYLKQSFIISKMEEHGFEFVGESNINANPKDLAGEGDIVWRLPPSLNGTRDDAEKRAAVEAIGESNRMTLKFRKPS